MGRLELLPRDMIERSGEDALTWAHTYLTNDIMDIVRGVFPGLAQLTVDNVLNVVEFNQTFNTTAGPYAGIAGSAFTTFHITVVHLPVTVLCFVDRVYFGCRNLEGLRFGSLVDDLHNRIARPYDAFVRTGLHEELRPAITMRMLAKDILAIAIAGGMPDSFWFHDSRIAHACAVLNLTPEIVLSNEWSDLFPEDDSDNA